MLPSLICVFQWTKPASCACPRISRIGENRVFPRWYFGLYLKIWPAPFYELWIWYGKISNLFTAEKWENGAGWILSYTQKSVFSIFKITSANIGVLRIFLYVFKALSISNTIVFYFLPYDVCIFITKCTKILNLVRFLQKMRQQAAVRGGD